MKKTMILVWLTIVLLSLPQLCLAQFNLIPSSKTLKVNQSVEIYIAPMMMLNKDKLKNYVKYSLSDTTIAKIEKYNDFVGIITIKAVAVGNTTLEVSLDGMKTSAEINVIDEEKPLIDAFKYPLLHAVMEEDLNKIKALIKEGINLNIKDEDGWTALHFAAYKGNSEIGEILILEGVDYLIENNDGRTPFIIAKEYGKSSFIHSVGKHLCSKSNESVYLGKYKLDNSAGQLFVTCK